MAAVGGGAGRKRDRRVHDGHGDHHPRRPAVPAGRRPARAARGTPPKSARASARRDRDDDPEAAVEPRASRQRSARAATRLHARRVAVSSHAERPARARTMRRGSTATQNAARKSPAKYAIAASASSGRRWRPTVSSACRKPKLAPRTLARRHVGDQRIARRAANPLADPIGEARRDDPSERRRERKRELATRRRGRSPARPAACACAPHPTSTPENTLTTSASASATPSTMPIDQRLRAQRAAMYSGSSAWISSLRQYPSAG